VCGLDTIVLHRVVLWAVVQSKVKVSCPLTRLTILILALELSSDCDVRAVAKLKVNLSSYVNDHHGKIA